jgi:PAS domain S-box-containing protein
MHRPGVVVEQSVLSSPFDPHQPGGCSRLAFRENTFCGAAGACKNPSMLTRFDPGKAWRSAATLLLGCAALAATTAIAFELHTRLMTVSLVYVIVIALVSMTGEVVVCVALALFAAVCLIYFFLSPIFSFAIEHPTDIVALITFFATALLVTNLVNRARRLSEAAGLQEIRLSEAQRIAHAGWWERDFRTNHVSLSEEVCRIFGLEPVNLPDWHERWLALIHPEDRPKAAEASAAALAGGPRYDVEYRVVRPDGTVRVVHSQGDVTWDEAGRALRQFGVLQDITELRQAERELRASEARFRTFVDHATDAFFLLDDQLTVLDVNGQAADSLGYSRDELIGMHPRDIDVDQDEVAMERVRQRVVTGEQLTFETHHRRKDGTVFPVEIRIGHFEQDGHRFLALARDITERKRVEQRVFAEHAIARILAQAATVEEATPKILQALCECLGWDLSALWLIDREAGVLRCAELWRTPSIKVPEFEVATRASIFRLGEGLPGRVWESRAPACIPDVIGDPSFLRASAAAREGLHAVFAFPILLQTEVLGVIDLVSREKFQPDQELLEMMAPIGSQVGQFIERKRAEGSLRAMQSELAHANRVATMGQLTASISHEVAQPVAASITNANAALRWIAAEPPDLDEVRAALDRILRNGKRASEVIGGIRALVRRETPRNDRFDLNEMIREVIVLTQAELGRNGISLRTELAESLPAVIGDRIQLQQVTLNLILNAVEAMAESRDQTADLLIRTEKEEDAGGLRVTVCDSGPGLPPESTRLFEAFYTTKSGGMGMGLSICRSIVEAHGGRIWAEPNDPHGAVFHVTLPHEQAHM